MPQMEFEPTIPAFERAKTVHTLDRAATVIGKLTTYDYKVINKYRSSLKELFSVSSTTFIFTPLKYVEPQ
jgi:hypothetical protein